MPEFHANSVTEQVQRFYEAYPYPNIDPDVAFRSTVLGTAWCVVHHALGGRVGRKIRILIAGGGTGVALQVLGTAFRAEGVVCEFVYVDLSNTAADIARERAKAARIDDVRYLIQPIESLDPQDVGLFDYIDFSGVINHVADPAAVLAVLAGLLAPQGGIGMMAYGRLGRTGIYPMQNALRLLTSASGADIPSIDPVATMQGLLGRLPAENWIRKNPHLHSLDKTSTIELADRFLNPNDRAFEITELDTLCQGAGLAIRGFVHPILYDPDPLLPTREAKARASRMSMIERAQLAEWLTGVLHIHMVFATPRDRAQIDVPALLARPETRLMPGALNAETIASIAGTPGQPTEIVLPYGGLTFGRRVTLTPDQARVVAELPSTPSIGAVRRALEADGIESARIEEAIRSVYALFSHLGLVHLWLPD